MAFTFSSRLTVDIEGKKFEIDTSKESVIQSFQKLSDRSQALYRLASTEQEPAKSNEAMQSLCHEFISDLLGEGAFDQIFEGRKINTEDIVDLTCYLCQEVREYKERRLARYTGR